ncbi:hypothetical protein ABN028_20065 [Actinopolymorpha sp. B17G11]|uniref:hypothetical protein n=1 Tax=Actinopolymorpha sp. B17G11 TaxID=3160861 RepID=UPI0032E39468
MARLWSCGFELQSAAAGVEFVNVNGSPTIDTGVRHSGAASLRCQASGSLTSITLPANSAADANAHVFLRGYFRLNTYPSGSTAILAWSNSPSTVGTAGSWWGVSVDTDGTLFLAGADGRSDPAFNSAPLQLGIWYRVEMEYDDTTDTLVGRLNGVQWDSMTAGSIGAGGGRYPRWGVQHNVTCDLHVDDCAINDASGTFQNSWPGNGRIVHLVPNGVGDSNTWQKSDGTAGTSTNWQQVDEVIPDDNTTHLKRTSVQPLDDYQLLNASAAGIPTGSAVNLVAVGVRGAAGSGGTAASTARDVLLRVKGQSGGTVLASAASTNRLNSDGAAGNYVTHTTVHPRTYKVVAYQNPQNSAAWTLSTLDSAQIGVQAQVSGTTEIRVSSMWALVDYTPPEVTGAAAFSADAAMAASGRAEVKAAAALSAASSLGLAGHLGLYSAASWSADSSLTAVGRRLVHGALDLSAEPAMLLVPADIGAIGILPLSAASSMALTGHVEARAAVSWSAESGMVGVPKVIHFGHLPLAQVSNLAAAAHVDVRAAAAFSAGSSMSLRHELGSDFAVYQLASGLLAVRRIYRLEVGALA